MKLLKWESVAADSIGHIERSKTPTGWLVRETITNHQQLAEWARRPGEETTQVSLTFVPDPDHIWLSNRDN